MTCPPEIAAILLEILYRGIISIRMGARDPEYCFSEADHLHNLPSLVRDYHPDLLLNYWDVVRPCYLDAVPGAASSWMAESWEQLRPLVESERTRRSG